MNKLGIMQGRLTNWKYFNPQQFPWQNWENEFYTAQKIGVECIEWMFNAENYQENPLWTQEGRLRIKNIEKISGVSVDSICANFFMQNSIADKNYLSILKNLLDCAACLEIPSVIIPLFGCSEPVSDEFKTKLKQNIREALRQSENRKTSILLETEWDAECTKNFIVDTDIDHLAICYDFGNAVGKGFDVYRELTLLGPLIRNIHIKDKNIGGTTVMLGSGDARFSEYFSILNDYMGNYIFESYYDEAPKDTIKNITYIKKLMRKKKGAA